MVNIINKLRSRFNRHSRWCISLSNQYYWLVFLNQICLLLRWNRFLRRGQFIRIRNINRNITIFRWISLLNRHTILCRVHSHICSRMMMAWVRLIGRYRMHWRWQGRRNWGISNCQIITELSEFYLIHKILEFPHGLVQSGQVWLYWSHLWMQWWWKAWSQLPPDSILHLKLLITYYSFHVASSFTL